MPGRPFRFIHAGDFHLETPWGGVVEVPDQLRAPLIDSPYAAAARVFDTVLAEEADFLVLSGDIFHVEHRAAGADVPGRAVLPAGPAADSGLLGGGRGRSARGLADGVSCRRRASSSRGRVAGWSTCGTARRWPGWRASRATATGRCGPPSSTPIRPGCTRSPSLTARWRPRRLGPGHPLLGVGRPARPQYAAARRGGPLSRQPPRPAAGRAGRPRLHAGASRPEAAGPA